VYRQRNSDQLVAQRIRNICYISEKRKGCRQPGKDQTDNTAKIAIVYWKPSISFSPPKNPTIGLTDMPGMIAALAAAANWNIPGECRSRDEVVITPIIALSIDAGTVFECLHEVFFDGDVTGIREGICLKMGQVLDSSK